MATTDWKSALAALGTPQEETQSENVKNVERKKRAGVVYSTNPNYEYSDGITQQDDTLPQNQQKLRLSMERAGRGGKTVTLVRGFVGKDDDLKSLAKFLKQACGVGGAVKDGEIIIQGDHRQHLLEILKKQGYTQTK